MDKNSTVQKIHIANSNKPVDFYNLDVIISGDEAQGLLKVLSDYAFALDILDQYDHQSLKVRETDTKELFKISYQEAKKAIEGLKTKFGGSNLFGNEKDDSFKSSLATIY